MAHASIRIDDLGRLPLWRHPVALLILMAIALPLAFSTWNALLNNFVVEVANFDGSDIGWLHSIREIPGFLAFGVVFVILFLREQTLVIVALLTLGGAVAVTAFFPSFTGIMMTTFIGSIGYHYYETANQSLQLQWVTKQRAPQILGWLLGIGSAASLLAYGSIVLLWGQLGWGFGDIYMLGGGLTVVIALYCWLAFPRFEAPVKQNTHLLMRRRYWLYYCLQFMSGARRQIFLVFAGFMMIERFGFEVHEITALFLVNYAVTMALGPLMGWFVGKFGERNTLCIEYIGLIGVFLAYGGIYVFGWGVMLAAILYVVDHLFFGLAFAQKTYFQKIADPADIAPTAAVAFTINHIAAVFLPALLGYLWLVSPTAVFGLAAGMACVSLALSLMIPRHPQPGHETVFAK